MEKTIPRIPAGCLRGCSMLVLPASAVGSNAAVQTATALGV